MSHFFMEKLSVKCHNIIMMDKCLNSHKTIKYCLYFLLGLIGTALVVWQIAVYRATALFNAAMAKQDIFKGVIETESINCDFVGNISFSNLSWKTDQGATIVNIPKGRIKINPEDLLSFRINPQTIRELVIEEADLRLLFNDKLKLEFLINDKSSDFSDSQKDLQQASSKLSESPATKNPPSHGHFRNLNLPERLPNWKVVLKNCRIAAKQKQKLYVMQQVNCTLKVKEHHLVDLDFSSGKLGGTMIGEGVALRGNSDLQKDTANYQVTIKNVVPSSLGLGKLSDPVTIQGQLTGTTEAPTLTGVIKFNTLDLHSMVFTKVSSDFRYQNGVVNFTNTTGSIWGGYVKASGRYHVDTQRYRIEGNGYDIDLKLATNRNDTVGQGTLDFKLLCAPRAKHQVVSGSFEIGKGYFKLLHFKRITGEVFAYDKITFLKNLKVVTPLLTVHKKAIRVEGKEVDTHPKLPDEIAITGDLESI